MRFAALTLLASFAAVQAVKFTSQASPGTTIDVSKGDIQVTWTDASTTQLTTAHLLLVNQAGGHTPFSYDFGEVQLASGSYTISNVDLPAGDDYQFELLATAPMNMGILALTQQFSVTGTVSGATLTLTAGSSGSATSGPSSTSTSSATTSSSISVTPLSSLTTSTGTSSTTISIPSGGFLSTTTTSTSTSTSSSTSSSGPAQATSNDGVRQGVAAGGVLAMVLGAVALLA
jgi:hypothetical protein